MKHDAVNVLLVDDQPGKLLSYEVMLEELGENLDLDLVGQGSAWPICSRPMWR